MIVRKPAAAAAIVPDTGKADQLGHKILGFLSSQRLPPTPANYRLGHFILSNADGLAARAVDAITIGGDRLTQIDLDRIMAAHGPPVEQDNAESAIAAEVRHQALRLGEIAARVVTATGQFTQDLGQGKAALGPDSIAIATIVAAMIDRSTQAEHQLAAAAREIETLRQEVESAKGDAARDALTGLLNRRGVLEQVGGTTVRDDMVLAICDIDHFKAVNDRYGHVVGDRVLKLVSASLGESCAPHIVARWGGEEFLIVMKGVGVDAAAALVDTARCDLAARNVRLRATDQPLGPITFSAGIAAFAGRRLDDAIRDADALLYRAKASGRNRVLIDPGDDRAAAA